MHDPPHPGGTIRIDCIEALGLTVTEAAKGLGVSRRSLSQMLNGRRGISAEMAIRFELAGWGVAEGWLRAQAAYDLWQARQGVGKLKVKRFSQPEPDRQAKP